MMIQGKRVDPLASQAVLAPKPSQAVALFEREQAIECCNPNNTSTVFQQCVDVLWAGERVPKNTNCLSIEMKQVAISGYGPHSSVCIRGDTPNRIIWEAVSRAVIMEVTIMILGQSAIAADP
jgi:hypothetical protein